MTSSICREQRVRTPLRSPILLQVSLDRASANKGRGASIDGVNAGSWINSFLPGLPLLYGSPIHLRFLPALTAHRGMLLGDLARGRPVHAASFLRERRMVLEDVLAARPLDLRLILTHEIFHFAWRRLGNTRRAEFDGLLRAEQAAAARGELGESSLVAKKALSSQGVADGSCWKHYACESFCDTGAWLFAGVTHHPCFQLAARWRTKRASWFHSLPPFQV